MRTLFEGELERLARTLVEQYGIEVVCRGDNAWTDGRRIVVPSVPQPMDEPLERMMVGFLDHEMAHVAFSDFQVAAAFEKRHPGCLALLNVVEDALIERRAMQRWPGVRRNLDRMFEQIRDRVVQLIAKRGPFERFCTAVYLHLSHHRAMLGLEAEVRGYEDLLDQFPGVQCTSDAAALSERLLERWRQRNRSPTSNGSNTGNGGAGNSAASSRNDGAGSPVPPSGSDADASGSTESGPSKGTGGNSPSSSRSESNADSEPAELNGGSAASSPSNADASGQAKPPSPPSPSGTPATTSNTTGGFARGSLIGEALVDAIAEHVRAIDGTMVYRPYTTAQDRITLLEPADEQAVRDLLVSGTEAVRRLRRGLTNALRSQEKRWWRDDQLRGELSPRTLHRLAMDRPRLDVFRVRGLVQGRSTAVSLLLDASGSMSSRKMGVAREAMRVLLEALGDLKIATEALTFTTGTAIDVGELLRTSGQEASALRQRYGRLSNLEIGVIKRFVDPVKLALSRLPQVRASGLTPLGESMQVAASRLAVRTEQRRILLVLTDGKAGCEGVAEAAVAHARLVAERAAGAGIELVGVGILDESVREVIPDAIVIQDLSDLSARLCTLLGRTLMKGVHRVG